MKEDQFTKLFKYIEQFRAEVNTKLDEKASQASIDKLINTIDGFVKRLDEVESEQLSRDAQYEKLLDWARKVSKKTGVPLKEL